MVAKSIDRVPSHTDMRVNEQIGQQAQMRVEYYRSHPDQIDRRLRELQQEWDVERMLETASACVSMYGLTRGILGKRRWLLLPLIVQGFFLQHAIQGWCPPLPVLRRLGFRTVEEIDRERYALERIREEAGLREPDASEAPMQI